MSDTEAPTVQSSQASQEKTAAPVDQPPAPTVVWQPNDTAMKTGSSRLIKNQRSKLLRQTILLVFILFVLLVGFLFFVFPNAPRLITLLAPTESTQVDDSLAPQPPTLYSVPTATKSAQFVLNGYSEPGTQVIVRLNGESAEGVTAAEDGSFTTDITFQDGDNLLLAVAQDEAGNESKPSREYTVSLDTTVPNIALREGIESGMSVVGKENKQFDLSGTTEPGSKVLVADRFVFANADGAFSYPYDLAEGENKITITVVDKAGNETTMDVVVNYSP